MADIWYLRKTQSTTDISNSADTLSLSPSQMRQLPTATARFGLEMRKLTSAAARNRSQIMRQLPASAAWFRWQMRPLLAAAARGKCLNRGNLLQNTIFPWTLPNSRFIPGFSARPKFTPNSSFQGFNPMLKTYPISKTNQKKSESDPT